MKYLLFAVTVLALFSCNKKSEAPDPVRSEDKAKAAALSDFLKSEKFRLTKYYSETPIDYIDTDQVVMQETQLWPYVSLWLKDDAYSFETNGDVLVYQNDDRIPTDTAAVLTRHFSVAADAQGVGFNFLGHEYQDLAYRLISFSDSNLVVWATWNGKKVISEYKTVP
jgi:hypothetical protein